MNNKYLLVTSHKLKQLVTPYYDAALTLRAATTGYHHKFWASLESKIANQKHTEFHIANVNMCNAKCVFCGQHKFSRPKDIMSMDTYNNIISATNTLGTVREFDFTPPLGEPLLDDGVFEKASRANIHTATVLKCSITTNGILLSNYAIAQATAVAFNDIRISLGGLDSVTYAEAYGVPSGEKVWKGLMYVLNTIAKSEHLKATRKVKLLFRSPKSALALVTHPRWAELQPYIDSGILSYEFTNYYDNWGGSVKEQELVGAMKMRTTKKKCGIPCFSLGTFFIEHQGNVRLCGCRFLNTEQDGLVVGNINKTSITKILSVDNLLPLYKKFMNQDVDNSPDVCQNCTLYRPMSL